MFHHLSGFITCMSTQQEMLARKALSYDMTLFFMFSLILVFRTRSCTKGEQTLNSGIDRNTKNTPYS